MGNSRPAIQNPQRLLSACHGALRVTIGWDRPEELRALSDGRMLTCPACGAQVVLHAGIVRAHHFAHLPGAVCSLPQTEPETEEHRAGKLLLARWLRERVPGGTVTVEAYLPATGQRADLLLEIPVIGSDAKSRRIGVEFQCANLSAREWRRRHGLYRAAGIEDLWILGGTRCRMECAETERPAEPRTESAAPRDHDRVLHTGELERALIGGGAPLLFLDPLGTVLPQGTLARFRPSACAQILRPEGRLSAGRLLGLDFPYALLDRLAQAGVAPPPATSTSQEPASSQSGGAPSSELLWQWLANRFHVTPQTLPPLFGVPIAGQEAILCEPRLWQAMVYYRHIHQRVGMAWWLTAVESWTIAYLPLEQPLSYRKLRRALRALQDFFAAAGLLTLPTGSARSNARVAADLDTLPSPPDSEQALRIARYRRLVDR